MNNVTEIIESNKIEELFVERRKRITDFLKLQEVSDLSKLLPLAFPQVNEYEVRELSYDTFIKRLDKKLWNTLICKSPFFEIMPHKLKSEWREKTSLYNTRYQNSENGEIPAFTYENVSNQIEALFDKKEDMITDKIVDLFKNLSWDYKTNNPIAIGKKLILKYYDAYGYSGQSLSDLEDVLYKMNGKPIPANTERVLSQLPTFITETIEAENEAIHVKRYKNGNLHVVIKNKDNIDKLNKLIAKKYGNSLGQRRK